MKPYGFPNLKGEAGRRKSKVSATRSRCLRVDRKRARKEGRKMAAEGIAELETKADRAEKEALEAVGKFLGKFYQFRQNNSGGDFNLEPENGIGVYVIIEADSGEAAKRRTKGPWRSACTSTAVPGTLTAAAAGTAGAGRGKTRVTPSLRSTASPSSRR